MPPKGKQATKGQKQIKEENAKTTTFYTYIVCGSFVPALLFHLFLGGWNLSMYSWMLFIFSGIVLLLCLKLMNSMASSGLDLNMEQGMGEHLKDVIYVTAACLLLSCISNYFWFLWFIIPTIAFYKLWVSVISPWIFQEAPEVNEKKNKKMERKMKRMQ